MRGLKITNMGSDIVRLFVDGSKDENFNAYPVIDSPIARLVKREKPEIVVIMQKLSMPRIPKNGWARRVILSDFSGKYVSFEDGYSH